VSGLLCGLVLCPTQSWADLAVIQVLVDGQEVPLPLSRSSAPSAQPLLISSSAREVQFHFGNADTTERPCPRLRYKLEGVDEGWHDLPTSSTKILARFFDHANQVIGSEAYLIQGETPGWRYQVETSDFVLRQKHMLAPERAASMSMAILSGDPAIGDIAVDEMLVTVKPRADGPTRSFDLTAARGTDMANPLGTPSNWFREGSRAELAQLRTRPVPVPHPVLVIYDDDRARFGNWALRPEKAIPVNAGDQVTLEWKTAHSLGSSGPDIARFSRLGRGTYWFRVVAVKANGEPTGVEFSLPLLVVPPLYKRTEFWLVLLAATGVGSALISRYVQQRRLQRRLQAFEREREMENERARIARDLHDQVGAGLTTIAMLTDWVRRETAPLASPEVGRRMDSVCQSAVELTRAVDEIVWAVNPANDTLDRFVNYLTQYSEQFLDAAGLSVRFDIPSTFPSVVLPGKTRHFLFLAALEALNNVVKHSNASVLRLAVRVNNGRLQIAIEDNGHGFSVVVPIENGTHEGITNMRQRMEAIGGEFRITSQPGQGTRIELVLPLPGASVRGEKS